MTLDRVWDFYFQRPDYEKRKAPPYSDVHYNIDRARLLLKKCGNPEQGLRFIHLAGTNGKGSTIFALETLLEARGLRTAAFLSPHVEDPRERLRLRGELIKPEPLIDVTSFLRERINPVEATTFETLFLAFALLCREYNMEFCLLETGLGGRLDTTNVVLPALTILTSIARDHQHLLGSSLKAIAREKAGIIKAGIPCLTVAQKPEAMAVIEEQARRQHAPLSVARELPLSAQSLRESRLVLANGEKLQIPRSGRGLNSAWQLAAAALPLLRVEWPEKSRLRERLNISSGLPARSEFFGGRPPVLLDGAHNPAAARFLADLVGDAYPKNRIVAVIGIAADKELPALLPIFESMASRLILTTSGHSRAASPAELARHCSRGNHLLIPEPGAAWRKALALASQHDREFQEDGLIIISGSFYLAGKLRSQICKYSEQP